MVKIKICGIRRLEDIEIVNKYKPDYIRKQIEEQSQLSFIKFNDDDTIVVDDKSFKAIMDILKGKINLDLITKELNGVDEEWTSFKRYPWRLVVFLHFM